MSTQDGGGLGFRDFKLFINWALLGKQAWQLMNAGESLLHNVHKARYFSNFSFI